MEVELVSALADGTWRWRAAGAREPRGVIEGSLLHQDARVGEVLRVEVEPHLEGITIVSVLPRRQSSPEPDRLEFVAPSRGGEAGVTTSLVRRERQRDRRRAERPPRRQGERRGEGPKERGVPRERDRPEGAGETPRARRAPTEGRSGRPERPAGRGQPSRPREGAAARPPVRFTPRSVHRNALMSELAAEQRPIAEQLFRGGIPAVRQALAVQNANARAEGLPAVPEESVLAMAEELLPRVKAATWRDRAEAASQSPGEVPLRDLRSIVAGSDAARDEVSRELATSLRQALEERVTRARERWLEEVRRLVGEGRVLRALRASARPPDPGARFPADLALSLSDAASKAMGDETPPDRWRSLLEAVAESPVRISVAPSSLPKEAPEPLLEAARKLSGRVPKVAALVGVSMPPPPGPPRPAQRGQRQREARRDSRRPSSTGSPARDSSPSPDVASRTEGEPQPAEVPSAQESPLSPDVTSGTEGVPSAPSAEEPPLSTDVASRTDGEPQPESPLSPDVASRTDGEPQPAQTPDDEGVFPDPAPEGTE